MKYLIRKISLVSIVLSLFVHSNSYANNYELEIVPRDQIMNLIESHAPDCKQYDIIGLWEYRIDPVKLYKENEYFEKYEKKIDFKSGDIPVKLSEYFEVGVAFDMREHAVKGYFLGKEINIDREKPRPTISFSHHSKPDSQRFIFDITIYTDVNKISKNRYSDLEAPLNGLYRGNYGVNGKEVKDGFRIVFNLGNRELFGGITSGPSIHMLKYEVNKNKFIELLENEKYFSISMIDVKGVFGRPHGVLFTQQYETDGFIKALLNANGKVDSGLFLFEHRKCSPSLSIF